jgi:hypothetical protein
LKADPPLLGLKDEQDDFSLEMLEVGWRNNDPIHLYVIKPAGVEKPPVVLYLYGFPSENDRFMEDDFCKSLTRNGVAAVGFSSAYNGQRYHDRPFKKWFVSELQEALATSTHDVQMVLNYLETRGDLDMNRVGMFGAGSGASIAILAAAADDRIKALDVLNPWGDWPNWLATSALIRNEDRADFLKPEFLQRVAGLDPVRWLPKVKAQAVRVQTVGSNTVTSKTVSERIVAAAPPAAQITYYADEKALVMQTGSGGKAFEWIKAQLQTGAKTEYQATGHPAAPAASPGQSDR